ncbi:MULTISPECIES: MDR family MFS transporter [Cohnella]|uniref:EmrB/QacA subfamily drug resistance transporter n=1 Tax=Cohnella phaseoli TaxID=456490 RepID=A0A3D9KGJ0_9BACL|nr:MDR family MFS transporter [Cohnella phaseoli]RED85261.1 EmrB/QacA subfamily drug resistance transporter [Cohnella phaseoli]
MSQKQTNRTVVTIGLLSALFIGALDSTVVTTATTSIVKDLQGLSLIGWIFSIYTLTTCVTTPIFGKLADLFGRKSIFTIGLSLFLIGSVLCGAAETMTQLIWFRAIQGIGAGALTPVIFTIIGDMYTGEQRGKVQGVLSSMWSIAGLVGPFVGGYFVDTISWRWIFYMNIPISIISFVLVLGFMHEKFKKVSRSSIDYLGALTFTISISSLLLALLTGGETYAWDSVAIVVLFAVAAVFLVIFLYIETIAKEPMLPLSLFRERRLTIPYVLGFFGFCIVAGVTIYIPLWIQNVMGLSATLSGLMLMPMSLAWPFASNLSGRYMFRFGARRFMLLGTIMVACGALWLFTLHEGSSYWNVIGLLVLIGFGMGCINTPAIVTIQNSAADNMRGVATSTNSFMGTLGQTVAVAVFGMLFNRIVVEEVPSQMAAGMHAIFILLVAIALVKIFIAGLLPKASKVKAAEAV